MGPVPCRAPSLATGGDAGGERRSVASRVCPAARLGARRRKSARYGFPRPARRGRRRPRQREGSQATDGCTAKARFVRRLPVRRFRAVNRQSAIVPSRRLVLSTRRADGTFDTRLAFAQGALPERGGAGTVDGDIDGARRHGMVCRLWIAFHHGSCGGEEPSGSKPDQSSLRTCVGPRGPHEFGVGGGGHGTFRRSVAWRGSLCDPSRATGRRRAVRGSSDPKQPDEDPGARRHRPERDARCLGGDTAAAAMVVSRWPGCSCSWCDEGWRLGAGRRTAILPRYDEAGALAYWGSTCLGGRMGERGGLTSARPSIGSAPLVATPARQPGPLPLSLPFSRAEGGSDRWALEPQRLRTSVRGPADHGAPWSAEPRQRRCVPLLSARGEQGVGPRTTTSNRCGSARPARQRGAVTSATRRRRSRAPRGYAGPPWRWEHRRGERTAVGAFEVCGRGWTTRSRQGACCTALSLSPTLCVRRFLTSPTVVQRPHVFSSGRSSRLGGHTGAAVAGRLPRAGTLGRTVKTPPTSAEALAIPRGNPWVVGRIRPIGC